MKTFVVALSLPVFVAYLSSIQRSISKFTRKRAFLSICTLLMVCNVGMSQQHYPGTITVSKTNDFELSGNGKNKAWESASWNTMTVSDKSDSRQTRFKILHSNSGIYFLFHNEDEILNASKNADFERLWLEDVVEVFLWPDTTETIYFEYEISPLNYELPILIPNFNGKFLGWRPWQYEGERKTKHLTFVEGGEKKTGSKINAWYAEFFIPYALLNPLSNVPPKKGAAWRANMYRIDFDNNKKVTWSWRKTESNFHQYSKFGTLTFE